jgi:uncharacterized protein YciI
MKYVLTYHSTPDFMEKVPANIDAHRALWRTFHADKRLLMVGPFNDPPLGDAMAVFATREAAEEFVRLDPFVSSGIVATWTLREWNEVLV